MRKSFNHFLFTHRRWDVVITVMNFCSWRKVRFLLRYAEVFARQSPVLGVLCFFSRQFSLVSSFITLIIIRLTVEIQVIGSSKIPNLRETIRKRSICLTCPPTQISLYPALLVVISPTLAQFSKNHLLRNAGYLVKSYKVQQY